MRIALFSSQFFNVINYLHVFSEFNHEFIWIPLVPNGKKRIFEKKMASISGFGGSIQIYPIFLHTQSNDLKNLLNLRTLFNDFREIFRTCSRLRLDAIIVFYVLDAYPVALLKNLLGYSLFVVATGGDINLHQSWQHTFVRKMIYKRSNVVFAVSKDLRHKIFRESGYESAFIPTGVDPSFFKKLDSPELLREKWGFNQKDLLLLTVSNLEKHKGVDVAIRTVELLRSRGIETAKLIIVGEGTRKDSLRKLVMERDLERNILFLGEKSKSDLLELYNIADYFVLSSYSEGLPFTLLEAMACKTVCVASPVGDIPSVIKDGYNGFLANSVTPDNFATKIQSALSMNQTELEMVRDDARETVVRDFDFRKIAESMLSMVSPRPIHTREPYSRFPQ